MEAREEVVKLRCTREEKERFRQLAEAEHTDVSTLIRRRVFANAAEVPAPPPSLFEPPPAERPQVVSGPGAQFYSGTTSGPGWPE